MENLLLFQFCSVPLALNILLTKVVLMLLLISFGTFVLSYRVFLFFMVLNIGYWKGFSLNYKCGVISVLQLVKYFL